MKTVSVFSSISRNNGGLSESGRRLHLAMAQLAGIETDVLGINDEFTSADLPAWSPVPVTTFPAWGGKQFAYAPALRRSLLGLNADVVHTHGLWQYPSIAVSAWYRKYRHPYAISPQGMLDSWALKNSAWKKRLAWSLYESDHLRHAACLRALSQAEAKGFRDVGLKNPICIIPNSIDLAPEDELAESGNENSPFEPFAQGRKVLLYLGRLHPKKGLPHLLRAWQALSRDQQGDTWILAIAGWDQGGHEQELRRLISEAQMENSVCFIGPQFDYDKALCYRKCDAFVLPSLSEGLPMVVLEAWAAGKPVIMTPECNLPEGFVARAALEVHPSTDRIVAGLRQLFEMSDRQRQEMGSRGLALVKDRFTSPRIALQMRDVYDWLLGGGPQPACVETI